MNTDVEKSIIKKFRKEIWIKFIDAVKEFDLINENDKIAICISGGKDSFLLAKCMQEIKKHGKIKFDLVFLCMDPGYNKKHLSKIVQNAENLNIDLHIFKSDIFKVIEKQTTSPCYLCARMRRGYLYNEAQKLGCNKIALGHHFDDIVETILMSTFYASDYKTMLPKLKSTNYKNMFLIRPLYYVKEENIIKWVKYNKLEFINCACSLTKKENLLVSSKREEIKKIIKKLKTNIPDVDKNIMKSTFNVNLDTIIGYTRKGKYNSNIINDK